MNPMENHKQWPFVKEVCQTLIRNGFKAYLAGGCVRDQYLNRVPADFDIVTNAKPDEIEALFEKTLDVGKKYGIIHVVLGSQSIEVATFRKDGLYLDGRHPESVEFAGEWEDTARRDFTINAMLLDMQSNQLIDHHGGLKDLKKGIIKCVGEPLKRFSEDHLRLLRAIRFSAQLNFEISSETWRAMYGFDTALGSLSMERKLNEWKKIIQSPDVVGAIYLLRLLLSFLAELCPNVHRSHHKMPPEWLLRRVSPHTEHQGARLACLYLFNSVEELRNDMEQNRFSKGLIETIAIHQSAHHLMQSSISLGQRVEILAGEVSFYSGVILENLLKPNEKLKIKLIRR
ncbi:MAG: CCA tRNA nucleotidyltransferase [Bdellovibrionales bacterium]